MSQIIDEEYFYRVREGRLYQDMKENILLYKMGIVERPKTTIEDISDGKWVQLTPEQYSETYSIKKTDGEPIKYCSVGDARSKEHVEKYMIWEEQHKDYIKLYEVIHYDDILRVQEEKIGEDYYLHICSNNIKVKFGDRIFVYLVKDENGNYTKTCFALFKENMKKNPPVYLGLSLVTPIDINETTLSILENKISELSDNDALKQIIAVLKKLINIEKKSKDDTLSSDELKFLYGLTEKVEDMTRNGCFENNGWNKIIELKKEQLLFDRNIIKDLAIICNCDESKILVFPSNRRGIKKRIQETDLLSESKNVWYFPKFFNLHYLVEVLNEKYTIQEIEQILNKVVTIVGDVRFDGWVNDKDMHQLNFKNLEVIMGDLNCNREEYTGMQNLKSILGNFDIGISKEFHNFPSLKNVYGDFRANFLTSSNGLQNLNISGRVELIDLEDATGLCNLRNPKSVYFGSLKSSKGLENLTSISQNATFKALEDATGLVNLISIGGTAEFSKLENADGLNNLLIIGGNAKFPWLKEPNALTNLSFIGGDLETSSLSYMVMRDFGWTTGFGAVPIGKSLEDLKRYIENGAGSEKLKKYVDAVIEQRDKGIHKK